MSRFRYRDDESSSTNTILGVVAGAVAGFAVGMLVAQRVGGLAGLTSKLRRRRGAATAARDESMHGAHGVAEDDDEFEDVEDDELESEEYDESLEEHVLEAFRNDPTLSERAIDIGSLNDGVIELAGWVEDDHESEHAVTIARGVPGVTTVVNRIAIGDEERRFEEAARRVRDGDASLTEAQWEGQSVGTGRRRQGTSDERDRHADPRVELTDRWQSVDEGVRNAADETAGSAERRTRSKRAVRGVRAGGSPIAPTGVPKGDHVAHPLDADREVSRLDATQQSGDAPTERGDQL
jgi:gas vesicle protein